VKRLATKAVHPGREGRGVTLPIAPPISVASVYEFPDLDVLGAVSTGARHEWFYRRYGHPNGRLLEEAVASLEGAEEGLACSSGMSAALVLFWATLEKGDHVVAAQDVYGGTYSFLKKHGPRLGLDVTFVPSETAAFERALRPATRAIFFETITNPLLKRPDGARICAIAKRAGARVYVDNTFATPVHARPLEWGADAVYHSGTKFLSGHGDAVSGVIVASKSLVATMRPLAISIGALISPLDAWLTLRGVRTLEVRVRRASENAAKLAAFLRRQKRVTQVHYGGVGPMLSFEVKDLLAAKRFVARTELVKLVPSLGDVATTMSHPARSSHASLARAEREAMGIRDGLIRVSTGLEDIRDLLEDFKNALR
jgi:cystathionine beta-lyase/cystathionine gamma-synthase